MKYLKTFEQFINENSDNINETALETFVLEGKAPINDLIKKMPGHVKGWAKYIAQHPNGEWWYYDDVPKLIPKYGWSSYDRDGNQFASGVKSKVKNWEASYQKLDKQK